MLGFSKKKRSVLKKKKIKKFSRMEPTIQIPSSLRYDPTDEQMMFCLINKIEGRPAASKYELLFIEEKNLYEANKTPHDILPDNLPWKDSKDGKTSAIYVITKLSKRGKYIDRQAGCGTWNQKPASKPLTIGDYEGKRRTLTFKPKPDPSPDRKVEGWSMHEISIPKHAIAMCKITKQLISNKKRELAEEGNSHGKKHCMRDNDIPLYEEDILRRLPPEDIPLYEELKKRGECLLTDENEEVNPKSSAEHDNGVDARYNEFLELIL